MYDEVLSEMVTSYERKEAIHCAFEDDWVEQPIQAYQVVAVENEPSVFLNVDGSVAGLFASDIVESWQEENRRNDSMRSFERKRIATTIKVGVWLSEGGLLHCLIQSSPREAQYIIA